MTTTASISLEKCAKSLAGFAGEENVRVEDGVVVCAPGDTAQVSALLRFAHEHALVVMPTGGGTKLGWGNAVEPNIRLETARMNQLREHAWQDMTCTVEAGCTWGAMQSALAQHGQMVALDPVWPAHATLGGIVATNDGGSLRLKYGGLRDLIIGMTVVLADGTVAKTGGKVVKNVAGYDLHKLVTGSFGTLAVITEVNFRLHPMERSVRSWSARAKDAAQLAEPLRALLDAQMTPSSIQIRTDGPHCLLDVRIASRPEVLDTQAGRMQAMLAPFALEVADDSVWLRQQDLFDLPNAAVLKATLLSSEICSTIDELQCWAAERQTTVSITAQAAGIMTVAIEQSEHAVVLVEWLRSRLRTTGGSVVALRIPDAVRAGLDVWGCESSALPLMREIKRRFDPKQILNPGRFVGNI